ncbi:hypothetical protein Fmac_011246 [Flemingia macrophylla]|uniref:Uncharacterized protein n=1 Tax=Flemingia macrophylla TaxID=520843 RepID=A0ABD1MP09_9FABA
MSNMPRKTLDQKIKVLTTNQFVEFESSKNFDINKGIDKKSNHFEFDLLA